MGSEGLGQLEVRDALDERLMAGEASVSEQLLRVEGRAVAFKIGLGMTSALTRTEVDRIPVLTLDEGSRGGYSTGPIRLADESHLIVNEKQGSWRIQSGLKGLQIQVTR